MVETVDSSKLADRLNRCVEGAGRQEPLPVMVQVGARCARVCWCVLAHLVPRAAAPGRQELLPVMVQMRGMR